MRLESDHRKRQAECTRYLSPYSYDGLMSIVETIEISNRHNPLLSARVYPGSDQSEHVLIQSDAAPPSFECKSPYSYDSLMSIAQTIEISNRHNPPLSARVYPGSDQSEHVLIQSDAAVRYALFRQFDVPDHRNLIATP